MGKIKSCPNRCLIEIGKESLIFSVFIDEKKELQKVIKCPICGITIHKPKDERID